MNLILTERCDKRCSFCFTPATKKTRGAVMGLETIAALLERFSSEDYQLLGGEPTQHPRFRQVLELFEERGKQASLVSNLLFDQETLDLVLAHLDLFQGRWILANAMELDQQDRLPAWRDNFLALRAQGYECQAAITITPGNIGQILEYTRALHREVGLKRLRVGLDLYGNAGWVVRNREIGDVFAQLDALGRELDFSFSCDCQVPFCVNQQRQPWHSVTRCSSPPLDVFPDRSACYCYPLKRSIRHGDVLEHQSSDTLHGWFSHAYLERQLKRRARRELPAACLDCAHYICGDCCICLGAMSKPPRTKQRR